MALDPSSIAAIIGGTVGLAQAGIGSIGIGKAQKKAESAIEAIPIQTIDPEIEKMLKMRQARLGMGLSSAARGIAQQGIESSAASATRAAQQMGRGAGLGTIGAIQKQRGMGYQQLAAQEEAAREKNIGAYGAAVGVRSAARARQIASEQEKQQLRANIELEKLAAKRAAVQQGMQGFFSSAAGLASSGDDFSKPKQQKANFGALSGLAKSKNIAPWELNYGPGE